MSNTSSRHATTCLIATGLVSLTLVSCASRSTTSRHPSNTGEAGATAPDVVYELYVMPPQAPPATPQASGTAYLRRYASGLDGGATTMQVGPSAKTRLLPTGHDS